MNNFNVLTIVVLAILAISTFIGWKKGLIRMVLSLVSLILALILAWILFPHVSSIIGGFKPISEGLHGKVSEVLTETFTEVLPDVTPDSTGTENQNTLIDALPLPQQLKDSLSKNNNIDIYEALGVDGFVEYLATSVTSLVIKAISLLLTLVIAFVGLHLLLNLIDLVAKLPVLSTFNQTGGAVAGLVIGYLIMQVLFLLITTFSATEWGMSLMTQIQESKILTFLYNSSAMIKMVLSELSKTFQS